jgi:hypothetical protein
MTHATALRDRFLGEDPRFRRFVLLLAVATALPMIGVPLTRGIYRDATAMLSLAGLMTFLGGPGHVALTTWFFADPVARDHFRVNPMRYLWVPLALIVGTTAAYAVWQEREPTRWINLFFSCWLLWHYQKQNWGVHSFVSRVASGESASKLEEWILKIAVIGGTTGAIHSANFGAGTAFEAHSTTAFQAGMAITALLPVLIAIAISTVPALRSSPLRLCTLLVTSCFFLPVFLFADPGNAVLTYGLAHGLQYLVFMSYVAGATANGEDAAFSPGAAATHAASAPGAVAAAPHSTSSPVASAPHAAADPLRTPTTPDTAASRPGIVTLVVSLLGVGFFLTVCGDVTLVREWNLLPLFGLSMGITMAHFVVDAGIWRLRDEFPRRYVGAAFPFLSARPR